MNFSYNLKAIMDVLNCSNNNLAIASNLNPTLVSKFKNDIRIPIDGSNALNALINGLCKLTIDKKKSKQVRELCNNNEKELFNSISKYFVTNSKNIRLQKENNILIGINLDTLMKTLNVTNVMISKYLSKDSSLISKYKTNKRYIMRNDPLIDKICDYFYNYIIDNNLFMSVSSLFKTTDINDLKNKILNYLFTESINNSSIYSFLENLSDFKVNTSSTVPNVSLVPEEILDNKQEQYIGTIEFRNSVKRFLGNTCLSNQKTTLYLYSNENMKWMTEDKEFYNIWKMLMMNTLMNKNKIKIIHNINRNTEEMLKGIESWIPLYMTGLIEPYYYINNNDIFNYTLFIADDLAVIYSMSIKNKKDNNIYNYTEKKDIIKSYKEQFINLIDNSKQLIRIYVNEDIDKKLKDINQYTDYPNKINNINLIVKNDNTEVLILKTDIPRILFEFTYPKMIDLFRNYITKN